MPAMLVAVMAVLLSPAPPATSLDAAAAARFATLALDCVGREYPNKIAHVLSSEEDVRPPHILTKGPSSMAEAKQAQIKYEYVDRPEVAEVFADFVQRIQFDGQTLRFEFCVSRLEDQRPGTPASGTRYPACRLVLSTGAAIDLMNKMQQITASLVKAGVLKADAAKAPETVS